MNKKQKRLAGFMLLIILILLVRGCEQPFTIDSGTGDGTPSAGSSGGGGGGGSSSSGTTPPEDGFQCEDCTAEFVSDPFFQSDRLGIVQRISRIPQGTWECRGSCEYNGVAQTDYNCVPNPTNETPEGGYDDYYGEKPECWCLKEEPGQCNWYDSNYGEDYDNLQCGGSCSTGQTCASWTENGKDICECVIDEDSQEDIPCGFHNVDSGDLTSLRYVTECFGSCTVAGDACKQTIAGCMCIASEPDAPLDLPDAPLSDGIRISTTLWR